MKAKKKLMQRIIIAETTNENRVDQIWRNEYLSKGLRETKKYGEMNRWAKARRPWDSEGVDI